MKRVGLMAGLMVLVLGTGAVAQSPSPVASPPFAPDDLSFTLPSAIGEYELTLVEGSIAGMLATTPEQREFWRQVLLPFGKSPEEGRLAFASAYTTAGDLLVLMFAMRVAGVPADSMTDVLIRAMSGTYEEPPEVALQWLDIDGRRIQAVTGDEWPLPAYLYPKGDVLYFVGITSDADLAIEDVLAELP